MWQDSDSYAYSNLLLSLFHQPQILRSLESGIRQERHPWLLIVGMVTSIETKIVPDLTLCCNRWIGIKPFCFLLTGISVCGVGKKCKMAATIIQLKLQPYFYMWDIQKRPGHLLCSCSYHLDFFFNFGDNPKPGTPMFSYQWTEKDSPISKANRYQRPNHPFLLLFSNMVYLFHRDMVFRRLRWLHFGSTIHEVEAPE